MPIRRHLLLLVFSIVLPAVFACGLAILFTYTYERHRSEDNLLRTTQALAESLDLQVDAMVARLQALATSPALARGDMEEFWRQALRTVTTEGTWVVLIEPGGRQVINTLRPFGTPLPRHERDHPFTAVLARVVQTRRPVLSDVFFGPVTRAPTVAVTVPVLDPAGRTIYALSMGIAPSALDGLISSTSLPSDWLVGVFDSQLATVARSRELDTYLGRKPVPALAQAMRSADSGLLDAASHEGIPSRIAFSRAPRFGWYFAIGVPTADLVAAIHRMLLIFAGVAAGLIAVGMLIALHIGRRISGAITTLVPAAAGLPGGGNGAVALPTGVAEVDDVAGALADTAGKLRAMEAEQQRAAASLTAAKERAEDILSSIADGFLAIDAEWNFTYINSRARQILGKEPEEVIGRPYFDVFPQVRGSLAHQVYARVLADRRPEQFDLVSPVLGRWFSFSVYPAGDGGISVYFRDISGRKAAEAALIAARDEAERANRAKTQFLASASHDLRQPVQSLYFFHAILADQVQSYPCAPVVATMKSALDAMKTLLDGLLDISRLHAGTIRVTPASFPVSLLLDRLAAEYAPRAAAQGITMRVVASSAVVRSDMAQLERILRNLIDNALKYTPDGGRFLVGCRRGGAGMRIEVLDTGPGIPLDKQEAVFEEFVQLANPERDRAKGLGLGLAIVRHLGLLLGHRIAIRSRPGHGTAFSITVPRAGAEAGPSQGMNFPDAEGRAAVR